MHRHCCLLSTAVSSFIWGFKCQTQSNGHNPGGLVRQVGLTKVQIGGARSLRRLALAPKNLGLCYWLAGTRRTALGGIASCIVDLEAVTDAHSNALNRNLAYVIDKTWRNKMLQRHTKAMPSKEVLTANC